MRIVISLVVVLSLLAFSTKAQDTKSSVPKKEAPNKISAMDAEKYVGASTIVTGKVAQVTIREKLVYLNLDKPFPDSPFTGIIFAKATNQFGDLKQLKGKEVEIKGKITEYRDKAQIVLESTNQLKVVEKAGGASGTSKD